MGLATSDIALASIFGALCAIVVLFFLTESLNDAFWTFMGSVLSDANGIISGHAREYFKNLATTRLILMDRP